jgi:WD40 repeat protein
MKWRSYSFALVMLLSQLAMSQTVLEGHMDRVRYVAFLADGKTLLSGSEDYTIRLWDLVTGKQASMWEQLSAFKPGPSTVLLSLSSDGNLLARGGASQGSAELWDVPKHARIRAIGAHQKPLTGIALSGDGNTMVTFSQDELKAWNLATGKVLFGISAPALYSFRAAVASHDGKLVAVATSDKVVSLFESDTKKLVHQWDGGPGQLAALTFSPDAMLLASAGDGDQGSNVHVWNINSGTAVPNVLGPPQSAQSLAISRDGRFLAAAGITIRVFDLVNKKIVQEFNQHTHPVDAVAFSPDGTLLAGGSQDWSISVWKLTATH